MPIRVFPTLVGEVDDQDKSTHKHMGETDEDVQNTCLAFDDNLDIEVNNIEIEEDDFILRQCFIWLISTISSVL
jgi:hypothetical protein